MLAPFATLVFLSAIWLAAVVISRIFAGSGARIAAALDCELVIELRPRTNPPYGDKGGETG